MLNITKNQLLKERSELKEQLVLIEKMLSTRFDWTEEPDTGAISNTRRLKWEETRA